MCLSSCPVGTELTLSCLSINGYGCAATNLNVLTSGGGGASGAASALSNYMSGNMQFIYPTTLQFNKICMPSVSALANTQLGPVINDGVGKL